MKNGYILGFFIFPIFLEGCCVEKEQKKVTDLQQAAPHQHYRAVEGEVFMMPCVESVDRDMKTLWSRTGEGTEVLSFICGTEFLTKENHTGNYTHSGSEMFFYLQVVERDSLGGCFHPEESHKELIVSVGGNVSCPGLNCSSNTNVIWYKHTKSAMPRESCQTSGRLQICQVNYRDTGVYFCDRQIIEKGVTWIFRRAVNVTATLGAPSEPPSIKNLKNNTEEEVEIGRPYTLMCEVHFPFERDFSRKVQWYMNYGGKVENMTPLHMEEEERHQVTPISQIMVTQRAIIKEVTRQCLSHTYTCITSNGIGCASVTIKLKEKIKEKGPPLVGCLVTVFFLVTGLGIVLHLKWLEIQLIYRSHLQDGKNDAEKEFDVFLSYVWSPPSAEVEGVVTVSFQKEPDADEEEHLSSTDLLNTDGGKATQKSLEVLLPKVLEGRWGYRLCLLERDVLPGGAYTNDVVLAIQRSRMLICLLSADYLSNSNAVFVLESGVQALLQKSSIKLLLIWTTRASASLIQPDPPLPTLVQRALKVLPSLDWTSGKPTRATSNFWKSLRKTMPDHRVKLVSLTQDQ